MNFSGLNDSLKYSYQQFCKQDAEGREHSRQWLVRLHQFDIQRQELSLQTQGQKTNLAQYERMLMQQNPLLWAQIQRSMAVENFDGEPPLTALPLDHTFRSPKEFKEKAINTTNSSSTSADQHSLHEDGVWPLSPSPHPDASSIPPQSMTINKSVAPILSISRSSSEHHHNLPTVNTMEQLQPPRNFPASTPEDLDPVNQMERFLPFDVSTPNINRFPESKISPPPVHSSLVNRLSLDASENKEKPNNLPIQSNLETMSLSTESKFQEKFQFSNNERKQSFQLENVTIPQIISTPATVIQEQNIEPPVQKEIKEAVPAVIQQAPAKKPDEDLKPFRLDSESEGGEEVLSGPLSGQAAGDDDSSDSFWK